MSFWTAMVVIVAAGILPVSDRFVIRSSPPIPVGAA